jgi:hypothetical protein
MPTRTDIKINTGQGLTPSIGETVTGVKTLSARALQIVPPGCLIKAQPNNSRLSEDDFAAKNH